MYFPIMRGKQYELMALRELAGVLSPEVFKPIIEPVKTNLNLLRKTIRKLNENLITPIIIINPNLGEFDNTNTNLLEVLQNEDINYIPCVKVISDSTQYTALINQIKGEKAIYIFGGFQIKNINLLADAQFAIVDKDSPEKVITQLQHVVLMQDSFKKKARNADYADSSYFSDSHTSYKTRQNVIGFGDYTIAGAEYSERGGPAYVVTIHLSYTNTNQFDAMHIRHFSSQDNQSPTNPGGKFSEALNKLINYIQKNPKVFVETIGLREFKNLHQRQHYPGLGVVKKISMKHHMQTICMHLKDSS